MNSRVRIWLLVLADVLASALCWFFVLWAYKACGYGIYHRSDYLAIWPLFVTYALFVYFERLYKLRGTYPLRVTDCVEEFKGLCLAALGSHALVMVYLGFMHQEARISRFVLLVACALTMLVAQPARVLMRRLIRRLDPAAPHDPVIPFARVEVLEDRGRAMQIEKSIVDRVLSVIIFICASPAFIIFPILIKLDSEGPVFYKAKRLGKKGRPIEVWKFRTMKKNADQALERLLASDPKLAEEFSRTFKLEKDPRVTRVGRILRKTSLDELPQLFNVLGGKLALIGPRPIVEKEKVYYADHFDTFASVKPGVTGLWQCTKRSDVEDYAERVDLDVYYVQNWSPWMDLWIVFKTIYSVLFMKGAK